MWKRLTNRGNEAYNLDNSWTVVEMKRVPLPFTDKGVSSLLFLNSGAAFSIIHLSLCPFIFCRSVTWAKACSLFPLNGKILRIRMLRNTFIHVPGFGIKSEQRIWSSGFILGTTYSAEIPNASIWKGGYPKTVYRILSRASLRGNPNLLRKFITKPTRFWRFSRQFRESTAYLDIETTGLDSWSNEITTIALYDGNPFPPMSKTKTSPISRGCSKI